MVHWTDFLNNAINSEIKTSLTKKDLKESSKDSGSWANLLMKRFTTKN